MLLVLSFLLGSLFCATMTKTKTRPYDAPEYLETPEDVAAYLEAVMRILKGVDRFPGYGI